MGEEPSKPAGYSWERPPKYSRAQHRTEVGLVVACVGVFVLLLFDPVLAFGLATMLIGLALIGPGTRWSLNRLAVARYREREQSRRRPTGGTPAVVRAPAERVAAVEAAPTYPWSFPWPQQPPRALEQKENDS